MDWGEERDDCDVKTQMSVVEKPIFVQFRLVLSSVAIFKKATKENSDF